MPNIFEALRADHDRHRELMATLAGTEGDTAERRELFAELRDELLAHGAAEERAFYAPLLEDTTSQDQARHGIHEHEKIHSMLDGLGDMDPSNPNWIRKFGELRHDVEHHLEEEEHGVFQLAGKVLDDEQKVAFATHFEAAKANEMQG